MLPTPSTSHVPFNCVYEPAEDSYLFLDALSSPAESAFLLARFGSKGPGSTSRHAQPGEAKRAAAAASPSPLVVEIGTGSGLLLAFVGAQAQEILGRRDVLLLGTDVNAHASRCTKQTVRLAAGPKAGCSGIFLDALLADLAAPIRANSVDLLLFNPPYVPTPDVPSAAPPRHSSALQGTSEVSFEEESHWLSLAYAGGAGGMEVTERLLAQLPRILSSERGVAYILFCAQNDPEGVKSRIRAWEGGWLAETVASSGNKGGWEKLQIMRIYRS
ncbi:MAG: S-adenosylmethionine-dependent methyltransferase [Trizodia sp. TS-e1964]|nr:MAG: S-adenosylmethionine-dependent methyltransferase [Trizodia sp. TS-e1964]